MRIAIEPDAFNEVIETAVDRAIRRITAERPADEGGRVLLDKREAAAALGVSPATVDRLRRGGDLPAVKLEGRVLFRPEALHAWAAIKEERTPQP